MEARFTFHILKPSHDSHHLNNPKIKIILFVCRSLEQMEALFSGPLVVLFRKNHETVLE